MDTQEINEKLIRNKSTDSVADTNKNESKRRTILEIVADPKTTTEDIISILRGGTTLHKVRSLDRFYCRRYFIDLINMRLLYGPSSKKYMCRDVPYVDLCDLSEVQKGWNSDVFNVIYARFRRKLHASFQPKNLPDLQEHNCFSLCFDNGAETINFIAANPSVRDLWVKGLGYLVATCKAQQRDNEYDFWLRKQFRKADVSGNGALNFEEVLKLLNQLNISMHEKHARALFNASLKRKVKKDEMLNQDEFCDFYRMLITRPDLDNIFKGYCVTNTSIMGAEELLKFLKHEQKVVLCSYIPMTKLTLQECQSYIKRYEPDDTQVPEYLSIKGFHNLMMSIDFDIFNRSHRTVCQDMSQPIPHYYIASSHNTYLLMNQIYGNSSVDGYRLALLKGCRCLELDVWDGDGGEPVIFHGYTLTSKIYLRDVLRTIKNYAFKNSQYPIILSIENHCSVQQQRQMASHFIDILGEYLHQTPVSPDETCWPSPQALARKILIKGKKLQQTNSFSNSSVSDRETLISSNSYRNTTKTLGKSDSDKDEINYREKNQVAIDGRSFDHELAYIDEHNESDDCEQYNEDEVFSYEKKNSGSDDNKQSDNSSDDDYYESVVDEESEDESDEENDDESDNDNNRVLNDEKEESENITDTLGLLPPPKSEDEEINLKRSLSQALVAMSDETDDTQPPEELGLTNGEIVESDGLFGKPRDDEETKANILGMRLSKASYNSSKKEHIAQEFSNVVNYCEAEKFRSFEECVKWRFSKMASFVENKSEQLAKDEAHKYTKHNQKHLSRVYPKGLRTDSSNYDPLVHWNVGCQLVALNYQTWSKPMLLNEALFSLNGRCGYSLKAEYLRKGKQYGYSGRSSVVNAPTNKPKKVRLTIISGQHIPKPAHSAEGEVVDPYVKLKVYGHTADDFSFRTKLVKNNGFNPIWNEKCSFVVRLPELAFIYFVVKDNSDTGKDYTLGQYMLPFQAIMEGYRYVRLHDKQNQPLIPASLFVHISLEDVGDYWSPQ